MSVVNGVLLSGATATVRLQRTLLDQPETLGDGDCETRRSGLLGQPTNTLTSFAHVAAGAWLAARISGLPAGRRSAAISYAVLVALTGAGSVAYHGPQFRGAQAAHDLPIFGAVGVAAAVPLVRRARGARPLPGLSGRRGAALAATAAAAGAAYRAGRTGSRTCRPDSRWQWHGLWHVGTAVGLAQWGALLWPPEAAVSTEAPEEPEVAVPVATDVDR